MASRSMCRAALLLCACLLAGAAASSGAGRHRADDVTGDDLLIMTERFRAWQAAHNRTYATAAEQRRRFEVYRRNVEHIEATNRRGGLSYELGENQFADLTREEFLAAYTMQPRHVLASRNAMRRLVIANGSVGVGGHRNGSYADDYFFGAAVPNSVDWRSKGAVTPARSQMGCGSCWAFATVASIESLYSVQAKDRPPRPALGAGASRLRRHRRPRLRRRVAGGGHGVDRAERRPRRGVGLPLREQAGPVPPRQGPEPGEDPRRRARGAQQRGRAGGRRGAATGHRDHERGRVPVLQGRGALGRLRRQAQPRRHGGRVRRGAWHRGAQVLDRQELVGRRVGRERVRADGETRQGQGRPVWHRHDAALPGDVNEPHHPAPPTDA